ncbi:MAG: metallophosphoesterase [Bacteroidales bacterium]|nr:metallophosphoesterase [Bacteroidales bacterium]
MKFLSIITSLVILTACQQSYTILQLTDLHLQLQHPDQIADVFDRMDSLVKWEDPDLITITGDLVYSTPADTLMRLITDKLDSFERPWVVVYGNHDHEHGFTRAQLAQIIVSCKHTLNTLGPDGSLADIEIPVFNWHLYFLDSHAYSTDPVDYSNFSYAWFTDEQVQWVRETAGKHPDTPSIAFFHIPFPEYADTIGHIGTFGEPVCCGKHNPGMFDAMRETGFIATFCGHDHDNDYAVLHPAVMPDSDRASSAQVLLCYGRYSGSDGEYNHLPKGARVIRLHSNGHLDTWIRESSGAIQNRISL